ncbi:MAG: molybdopterin-guanine dinucleotide biosynthesis protein B [Burkholderiaceae bacterium]|jgi:molybdopterin-guanine dinucleotide biosynthesis protein B|nr:molybdopterin-guanine dinucleotide biosynthesis protein B [Burkholderiaceae bacterium]
MTHIPSYRYPVMGFMAYSGTGKTTLIEKLLSYLTDRGLKVTVIKHTHHDFDMDRPGKDSYRHREAGAHEVLLVSDQRWFLMHELRAERNPKIEEQLERISPCDLVIVEGFRLAPIPKIELWRAAHPACQTEPLRANQDPYIVALACPTQDQEVLNQQLQRSLPLLDLNSHETVAQFVLDYFGLKTL